MGELIQAYVQFVIGCAVAVAAVLILIAFGVGYWMAKPAKPESFNDWLDKHEQTCPQCGGDDSNGPPALCEEAFAKLRESIRNERD